MVVKVLAEVIYSLLPPVSSPPELWLGNEPSFASYYLSRSHLHFQWPTVSPSALSRRRVMSILNVDKPYFIFEHMADWNALLQAGYHFLFAKVKAILAETF